jgi:hypothetical protein
MGSVVFASTFTYAHTKLFGQEWVRAALSQDPDAPDTAHAVKTFCPARMAKVLALAYGQVPLMNLGSALVTRARSQAAGAFLRSDASVWLTFDDDVTSDVATVKALVECAYDEKALVSVPALARGSNLVNWHLGSPWEKSRIVTSVNGRKLYPILASCFSLVAMHRSIVEKLAAKVPLVGVGLERFPALFLERVLPPHWIGEDMAFCIDAIKAALPVYALLDGTVTHAGRSCTVNEEADLRTDAETALTLTREAETRPDLRKP